MIKFIMLILALQFLFLILLMIYRLIYSKGSIHLISVFLILLVLVLNLFFYQIYVDNIIYFFKFYFSCSLLFLMLLSTLERSVALGIIRKIYNSKINSINIHDIENYFAIKILVKKRLKNLINNKIAFSASKKIKLTANGIFICKIIMLTRIIFK
jgi:hypothetical protein